MTPTTETKQFTPEVEKALADLTRKHSTFGYAPTQPIMRTMAGATLALWCASRRRSMHEYDVVLCAGEWPSKKDLLMIADGTYPKDCNFGGNVLVCEPVRRVVCVYVD